jgi:glycosyl transferase family 25
VVLFDQFDRIRIVNLPDRKDRRIEMNRQLKEVSLWNDPRVAYFEAVSFDEPGPFLRKGSRGAFTSHLILLREAAEAAESILILQDDCDFLPGIETYEMPACDVFYGGYEATDPHDLQNSCIIGAHFMGFSARAAILAAEYLSEFLKPDFPPDPQAAQEPDYDPAIKPPIDGALVWFRRAHPEMTTEFALLSRQRPSRTDIGDQRWFDKMTLPRKFASIARTIKRSRHRTGGAN